MGAIIPVFAGCVLGAFYTCICCLYSGWYLRLYWLAVFAIILVFAVCIVGGIYACIGWLCL